MKATKSWLKSSTDPPAGFSGHIEVVKYLLSELNVDPLCAHKNCLNPSSFASLNGYFNDKNQNAIIYTTKWFGPVWTCSL